MPQRGLTALIWAARLGRFAAVKRLVEGGADIDATDNVSTADDITMCSADDDGVTDVTTAALPIATGWQQRADGGAAQQGVDRIHGQARRRL